MAAAQTESSIKARDSIVGVSGKNQQQAAIPTRINDQDRIVTDDTDTSESDGDETTSQDAAWTSNDDDGALRRGEDTSDSEWTVTGGEDDEEEDDDDDQDQGEDTEDQPPETEEDAARRKADAEFWIEQERIRERLRVGGGRRTEEEVNRLTERWNAADNHTEEEVRVFRCFAMNGMLKGDPPWPDIHHG